MKVLSLREPWASLITEGKKQIETRSWRTRYRGPLYLHASAAKINEKDPHIRELLALIPGAQMHYGHIVCRCMLTDCVPMDEAFLQKMERRPIERLCGEYAPGRFAWMLEGIEVLKCPVPAKGMLGLWEWEEDYDGNLFHPAL